MTSTGPGGAGESTRRHTWSARCGCRRWISCRLLPPDELHQAFHFDLLVQPWAADRLRAAIDAGLRRPRQPARPRPDASNHDVHRTSTRYGQQQDRGPTLPRHCGRPGEVHLTSWSDPRPSRASYARAAPPAYLRAPPACRRCSASTTRQAGPDRIRSGGRELARRLSGAVAGQRTPELLFRSCRLGPTVAPQPDWFRRYARDAQLATRTRPTTSTPASSDTDGGSSETRQTSAADRRQPRSARLHPRDRCLRGQRRRPRPHAPSDLAAGATRCRDRPPRRDLVVPATAQPASRSAATPPHLK